MSAQESFTYLAAVTLIAFGFTWVALVYARRRGLLDHPSERHSHTETTPRGGGVGIVLAIAAGAAWITLTQEGALFIAWVVPLMLVLSFIGWWDDHVSLSARFRFSVQLMVAALFVMLAWHFEWLTRPWFACLAFLYVVWMTNLYNFMDGSNGMAGLQGVFAGGVCACLFWLADDLWLALMAATLAVACLGFLPWNLFRPKVFMGDVGSLSLGFMVAALLVYGVGTAAFTIPVAWLVMLLFMTDASLTLLLRVMRGEQWYNAHKQHLYQRLIATGWNHENVATLYMGINVCLLLPALVIATRIPNAAWPLAIGLSVLMCVGWFVSTKRIGVSAAAS